MKTSIWLAVVLVLACSQVAPDSSSDAPPLAQAPQEAENRDQPKAMRATPVEGWPDRPSTLTMESLALENDVYVDVVVSLTMPLEDPATGEMMRAILVVGATKFFGIQLSKVINHGPIASASSEPMKVYLGNNSTSIVPHTAALALGFVDEDGTPTLESKRPELEVAEYTLSVAPIEGRTWAEVGNPTHLSITVAPTER